MYGTGALVLHSTNSSNDVFRSTVLCRQIHPKQKQANVPYPPRKGATLPYHTIYTSYDTFSLLSLFGSSQLPSALNSQANRKSAILWARRQAVVTGVSISPCRCIHWILLRRGFNILTVGLFSSNSAHSRSRSLNDRKWFHRGPTPRSFAGRGDRSVPPGLRYYYGGS